MKANIGKFDRLLRIVLGLAGILIAVTGAISSGTALVLGIGGGILILTGFVSFCPLYRVCGITTQSGSPDGGRQ